LRLPPLRDRTGDIPLLAQSFLKKFSADPAQEKKKFSAGALRVLEQYHWPGNVRELENRVRRALIMSESNRVSEADLELTAAHVPLSGRTLQEARDELEKHLVTQALERHKGNISATAKDLGISRPTLYELLEKFGLRKTELEEISFTSNP